MGGVGLNVKNEGLCLFGYFPFDMGGHFDIVDMIL